MGLSIQGLLMFLRRRVPEKGPLKAAVIGAGAFGRHHAAKYRAIPGGRTFRHRRSQCRYQGAGA